MHLIAVNDQVRDWGLGVGSIYSNPKPITASSGRIATFESLLDVMDIILQQFYVGSGAHNTYAQGREPMFRGVKVANFKTLNPQVTLIVNGDYPLPSRRGEARRIENRRFTRIASKGNESVACIA